MSIFRGVSQCLSSSHSNTGSPCAISQSFSKHNALHFLCLGAKDGEEASTFTVMGGGKCNALRCRQMSSSVSRQHDHLFSFLLSFCLSLLSAARHVSEHSFSFSSLHLSGNGLCLMSLGIWSVAISLSSFLTLPSQSDTPTDWVRLETVSHRRLTMDALGPRECQMQTIIIIITIIITNYVWFDAIDGQQSVKMAWIISVSFLFLSLHNVLYK